MSFTPQELRILRIADRVEDTRPTKRRPGRPAKDAAPLQYAKRGRWECGPRKGYDGPESARKRKISRESKARARERWKKAMTELVRMAPEAVCAH